MNIQWLRCTIILEQSWRGRHVPFHSFLLGKASVFAIFFVAHRGSWTKHLVTSGSDERWTAFEYMFDHHFGFFRLVVLGYPWISPMFGQPYCQARGLRAACFGDVFQNSTQLASCATQWVTIGTHVVDSIRMWVGFISWSSRRMTTQTGNLLHSKLENQGTLLGKSTISMAIFNSYVSHYQRVTQESSNVAGVYLSVRHSQIRVRRVRHIEIAGLRRMFLLAMVLSWALIHPKLWI